MCQSPIQLHSKICFRGRLHVWTVFLILLSHFNQKCLAVHLIDLSETDETTSQETSINTSEEQYRRRQIQDEVWRRQFSHNQRADDEKDSDIKTKISTLVSQTVHDTHKKIESIKRLKEKYREQPPYKIGFILSMLKKARDVLNELFNVAVKHRDDWKALEQLRIFELIVHTNVDTTNLVRQMVEIHMQFMNGTGSFDRRRIVLL